MPRMTLRSASTSISDFGASPASPCGFSCLSLKPLGDSYPLVGTPAHAKRLDGDRARPPDDNRPRSNLARGAAEIAEEKALLRASASPRDNLLVPGATR